MDNRKQIQDEFKEKVMRVRRIIVIFAVEIVEDLSRRDEFSSEFVISQGRLGKGKKVSGGIYSKSTQNDFQNYIWISVKKKDRETGPSYMISFNFQDIDGGKELVKNSGNPHMQLGRIQFWSGVNPKKGVCDSPHELISKDGSDITLKFCGSKMFDPKTAIYDEDYDHVKLVDEFLDFLLENEKAIASS